MLPTIWPSGFRVEDFFRNRPITLKSNYGSVFLTQNYELQFSFNYNDIQHIVNYKQQFSISFFSITYVVSYNYDQYSIHHDLILLVNIITYICTFQ